MWARSLGRKDPLERGVASTPGFLSGESRGQRSLEGYIVHGIEESWTRLELLNAQRVILSRQM